jgi:hypothetical protein
MDVWINLHSIVPIYSYKHISTVSNDGRDCTFRNPCAIVWRGKKEEDVAELGRTVDLDPHRAAMLLNKSLYTGPGYS